MHEGMVSVRAEEEPTTQEHVPLNARDLDLLNEALRPEGVAFLRNVATFVANARRQGLTVGYEDEPILGVRFDVEGPPVQVQSAFEEANARFLYTHKMRSLTEEKNYFTVEEQ